MKVDKCVLGVYETLDGIDIAGELCSWLKKHYKVYKVTQQPTEDNLYEYPGCGTRWRMDCGRCRYRIYRAGRVRVYC